MPHVLRTLGVLAASVPLSGCSLPYYWQAVGGQVDLLTSRTPIERALAETELEPERRAVLARVPDILEFAADRLGLPSGGSYESFVELERDYVVWNVVAAAEFSIEPKRWCFPFAGCVAYRGYFERADALEYRRRLEAEGLDTYVGGATAYSTLGYFDDPVLSTMLDGGPDALASLLFHELAHQKVYVKGDSEFNEAYATAIEEHGMALWLTEHGEPGALAAYSSSRERRDAFAELVLRQQRRLERIYASDADAQDKRRAKREAFASMRADYAELRRGWGDHDEYDAWFDIELNNASLAAVATYRRWLPALRRRLEAVGLERFTHDIEAAAELDGEARQALLERWARGA